MRLVADGDDPWIRICDLTIFVFVAADVVDDVLLHVRRPRALPVQRTNDVCLKKNQRIIYSIVYCQFKNLNFFFEQWILKI